MSLPDDLDPWASMLDAALAYAARGWPVEVLHSIDLANPGHCTCGVYDCGRRAGKHPRTFHGVKDATTDPDTIRRWFHDWPKSNIGLATGIAFDAPDLDGIEALDVLEAAAPPGECPYPAGPTVMTGRGFHIYVAPSGLGCPKVNLPKIDYKGHGGIVVAPPSIHWTGQRYAWCDPPRDALAPIVRSGWLERLVAPAPRPRPRGAAERPGASAGQGRHVHGPYAPRPGLVRATAYGRAALNDELAKLAGLPPRPSFRNGSLNLAAWKLGKLVAQGHLDGDEVKRELLRVALAIGLSEREARATIRSGYSAGWREVQGEPR